jgi:hypothetical protein
MLLHGKAYLGSELLLRWWQASHVRLRSYWLWVSILGGYSGGVAGATACSE